MSLHPCVRFHALSANLAHPVLVFLDFDGVLHRFFPAHGETDEDNQHFCFLPAFEAVVRANPRPVEIVITSTWRRERSLEQLRALFSPDIATKIIGATPRVGSGNGPGGRLAEVQAWLEENARTQDPWVAVDDYPEVFAPGIPLVVCHDAFREREAALLAQALVDPAAFALANPLPGFGPPDAIVLPGPA